ncbi:MAG TPA: hypothetical protein VJK30_02490 [Coxiellaceae bacterium]|nr:MAG: hypothetical protein A3E81_02490 [Gammaproteobacteria bacterium RIFCSPHIGHO2_12_FULL_36_30]HLB56183.1 hypothetical protein [Coxiellaceae bacterium]
MLNDQNEKVNILKLAVREAVTFYGIQTEDHERFILEVSSDGKLIGVNIVQKVEGFLLGDINKILMNHIVNFRFSNINPDFDKTAGLASVHTNVQFSEKIVIDGEILNLAKVTAFILCTRAYGIWGTVGLDAFSNAQELRVSGLHQLESFCAGLPLEDLYQNKSVPIPATVKTDFTALAALVAEEEATQITKPKKPRGKHNVKKAVAQPQKDDPVAAQAELDAQKKREEEVARKRHLAELRAAEKITKNLERERIAAEKTVEKEAKLKSKNEKQAAKFLAALTKLKTTQESEAREIIEDESRELHEIDQAITQSKVFQEKPITILFSKITISAVELTDFNKIIAALDYFLKISKKIDTNITIFQKNYRFNLSNNFYRIKNFRLNGVMKLIEQRIAKLFRGVIVDLKKLTKEIKLADTQNIIALENQAKDIYQHAKSKMDTFQNYASLKNFSFEEIKRSLDLAYQIICKKSEASQSQNIGHGYWSGTLFFTKLKIPSLDLQSTEKLPAQCNR